MMLGIEHIQIFDGIKLEPGLFFQLFQVERYWIIQKLFDCLR